MRRLVLVSVWSLPWQPIAFAIAARPVAAEILSDDLANATAASESASGDRWIAASLATGSDPRGYRLDAVTLRLAAPSGGEPQLDLYDDDTLEPGAWLGSLAPTTGVAADLAEIPFAASGITLEPDTTYWAVLSAASGELAWGWSEDSSGGGSGFQYTWGASDDAGSSWFSYAIYPTQMRVEATAPEPGTGVAGIAACASLAACGRVLRRRNSR